MSIAAFLDSIVPAEGVRAIGVVNPDGTFRGYVGLDTNAETERCGMQHDAAGRDVYLAHATFKGWYRDPAANGGKGANRLRTRANVHAVRSLVDDFDVGPSGYKNKADAYADVVLLARTLGVKPWVVDSGGGYHVYTPLDRDATPEEWVSLSVLKRRIADHIGVKTDRAVDLDPSHTLRLPGSHNRKRGAPEPVRVVHTGQAHAVAPLRIAMEAYVAQNGVAELQRPQTAAAGPLPPPPPHVVGGGAEWNGAELGDMPPSDADRVADECASVRAFRDGETISYPHWARAAAVVKHCTDGEAKVHEWSALDSRYDPDQTQGLLETLTHGPTTCDKFDELLGCRAGCPHGTTCKSPVRLGEPPPPKPSPAGTGAGGAAPFVYRWLPPGYSLDATTGWVWYRDPRKPQDADNAPLPVVRRMLYPIARMEEIDGAYAIRFRAERVNGANQDFSLPTTDLAGMREFAKDLAEREVLLCDHAKSAAKCLEMCKMQMDRITKFISHHKAVSQMGWLERGGALAGFVLGNKVITPKGRDDAHYATDFPQDFDADSGESGTLQDWINWVDRLYNKPGAEPVQFALLHSMGSPLVQLMGSSNWHGIPLVFTGPGGTGKSTMCRIAAGFWGNPELFERQTNTEGTTLAALIYRAQCLGSVPYVMDETSGWAPDILSQMFYALANGRAKERLNQRGRIATTGEAWFKNSVVSANDDIYEALSRVKAQSRAEATQLRVFEVRIPRDFIQTVFSADDRDDAETLMNEMYGTACEPYLRYIMNNEKAVRDELRAARSAFKPSTAEETRERFYRDAIATASVAGRIAKDLNLIRFDLGAVRRWAEGQVVHLRGARQELNPGAGENLAAFLASLTGRMIRTLHFSKKNLREAHVGQPLRDPVGRVASDDREVWITTGSLKTWCAENGVAKSDIVAEMKRIGLLRPAPNGANYSSKDVAARSDVGGSRTWCYELDYDMYFGLSAPAAAPAGTNVVQFPKPAPTPPLPGPAGSATAGQPPTP